MHPVAPLFSSRLLRLKTPAGMNQRVLLLSRTQNQHKVLAESLIASRCYLRVSVMLEGHSEGEEVAKWRAL